MTADYEDRVPDTPPDEVVNATKRKRRTRAEIEAEKIASGATTKPTLSRAERNSRYGDIFNLLYSANTFAQGFESIKDDALVYYDRAEVAKRMGTDEARIAPSELEQLAKAADDYQANSPKVHKWLIKFLEASPGVALLVVVLGLTLPRLERHGLLPWVKPQTQETSPEPVQESQNGTTPYPYTSTSVGAP